jgi:acetyltransferase-like isoleucine patch superfamily enzyme
MSKGPSHLVRKTFGLRHDVPLSFYIIDLWFRRILRQNATTTWAVHHTSTIHNPEKIVRGKWVFPGDSPGVYINARNGISIGDYTNIGPNVGIVSANHDFINNDSHSTDGPIVIGKHCWFGMGAVVLPGVILGDFTIVGAGAIVSKSFEEGYCVLAGNPARVIKQLNRSECDAFAQSKV